MEVIIRGKHVSERSMAKLSLFFVSIKTLILFVHLCVVFVKVIAVSEELKCSVRDKLKDDRRGKGLREEMTRD